MRICVQNGGITNRLGFDEGYRLIAEAGFEAIDWNIDVHLQNDKVAKAPELRDLCIFDKSLDEMLEFFAPELDAIKRNGLQIAQAHAPFGSYDRYVNDMIPLLPRAFEFCALLGIPAIVVHPVMRGHYYGHEQEHFDINMKFYRAIAPLARTNKVKIAIENMWDRHYVTGRICDHVCADPEELCRYYDELADPEVFTICLDLGHVALCGREPACTTHSAVQHNNKWAHLNRLIRYTYYKRFCQKLQVVWFGFIEIFSFK
jgi:sugar phosphate isomerase/epimerase